MRKINKSPLDPNILLRLSTFQNMFSHVVDPTNWKDPAVQLICDKYKDYSVKQSIRNQLESDQKVWRVHICCCYCECVIGWGNWDDVEHVKPKSKFPKSSLRWGNLLLACNTCNRSNKNDNYALWFLNISKRWYRFEDHFEYWKHKDKFILSSKSKKWKSTLKDMKEFKFDKHTSNSRYQVFWQMYTKIIQSKERWKSITDIKDDLDQCIWWLWKNYTFSKWLISDDINSPLYSELH